MSELVCPVCCIVINGPERAGLTHEHCDCAYTNGRPQPGVREYNALSIPEKERAVKEASRVA